ADVQELRHAGPALRRSLVERSRREPEVELVPRQAPDIRDPGDRRPGEPGGETPLDLALRFAATHDREKLVPREDLVLHLGAVHDIARHGLELRADVLHAEILEVPLDD